MFFATLVFVTGFFSRAVIARRSKISFDTYAHLYRAIQSHVQKAGPFGAIRHNVIGSVPCMRPLFWHWCIGFLPRNWLLKNSKYVNPFLDSMFAVLVYFFASWSNFGEEVAFVAAMLYIATPAWFSGLSWGPRTASFTPRLISELFTNLFFMFTLLNFPCPLSLKVFFSAFCAMVVFSSSKFGLQVFLFLAPLTSLIALSPLPLFSAFVGFFLVLLLSRGRFRKTMKEQIAHLLWYYKKNMAKTTPVASRNSLSELFFWDKAQPRTKNLSRIIFKALVQNSFTAIVFKMPVMLAATCLFINNLQLYPAEKHLLSPLIAGSLVFLVINIPSLLFLGEAERYLNHVAFFIVFLVALHSETFILPAMLCLYGFFYWFMEVFVLPHFQHSKKEQQCQVLAEDIIEWMNEQPKKLNVLCYPFHAVGIFRIMLTTPHKVLFNNMCSEKWKQNFSAHYEADYPYVKLELLDEMASEYDLTCLILSRNSLKKRGFDDWIPSSQWISVPVGKPEYNVYIHASMVTN